MAARTSTYFDTCKLTKVKFYLNSKFYPYDDLNLDFDAEPLFHDIYIYVSVRLTIKSLVKEMKLSF